MTEKHNKEKKQYRSTGRRRRRRKRRCTSLLTTALTLFLTLILLICGSLFYLSNRMLNRIERVDKSEEVWIAPEEAVQEMALPEEREESTEEGATEERADTIVPEQVVWTTPKEMVQKPKIKNILLIGQDRRPGETRARSDSMILCSINEYKKELTLVSFMRDMYVPFPGDYYPSRMNHSFAWGGMSMLDQLIEEDFGVHIDGNVVVDFESFVQVMDMIAPVNIDLKDYEVWYMNRGTEWAMHEGMNAMNGEQLLKYARMRYSGHADWERTERQRYVLTQAFNKVKTMSLKELTDLADAILPCISTDLSNTEIMSYIYTVTTNRMSIGETYRIPVEGTYTAEIIYGMDVLVPDLEANSESLHRYIYGS